MKWTNLLEKLKTQTNICKLCLKTTQNPSILNFLDKNFLICNECFNSLNPKWRKFQVDYIKAIAVYDYDETIKSLLYQFKGCFDYELKDVFFISCYKELSLIYKDYYIVPIPSYYKDDEEREFNHVKEMYKCLGLKMIDILEKTNHFKQANNTSQDRLLVNNYIRLKNCDKLSGKNILIVDDVFTTGSTMRAAIKLVRSLKPKDIKILVMAKTLYKD